MAKKKVENTSVIKNKKAYHNYAIEDTFECGIVLQGTEVKSLREGKANIAESHCVIFKGEAFLRNMHIAEYKFGGAYNHNPLRERKLLLLKREIVKIKKQIGEKGMALVPIKVFFNERGLAKVVIGLGKGKKTYDKRDDLKQKDQKRDIERNL